MDEAHQLKRTEKQQDREEEWKVLTNGNDYMRKRDEESSRLKKEAQESRVKINKTNEDTIRKQMRQDKFVKILNHRNGNQHDTFVDLLIKKEQDKRQRMREEFDRQDRVKAVAGTQYMDEDGRIQKVLKIPRHEKLREDELKANDYREA